jgi:pimeloyl-ACP methyl ester carboxylesterase
LLLVHGAFEGAWCWRGALPLLCAAGREAHAVTLTGSGERFHLLTRETSLATHVEDVLSLLVHEDLREVTLVGHSYGGAVVTVAADRARDRIRRVVYLDAAAPAHGQSASGSFGAETAAVLEKLSSASDDSWLLPPLPLEAVGLTGALAAWVAPRRHPHPMRALLEPLSLSLPAEQQAPRTYLACTRHEGLLKTFGADPLAGFVERARREGWDLDTLDAPHDAMLTHPEAVAGKLLALR